LVCKGVAERTSLDVGFVENVRSGAELVVTLSLRLVEERVSNQSWVMGELSHRVEMLSRASS